MNPVNSFKVDGTSANTTPSNPINDPGVSVKQGLNTFDLSGINAFTARFGEITPYFYTVAVPNDRTTLHPSHQLRTYTFGSPLLSAVRMHVQNFSVPLSSLMPNSWEYIYKTPVKGTDIPDDALCYFYLAQFAQAFYGHLKYFKNFVTSVYPELLFTWISSVMLYHSMFGRGSLLNYLGINSCYESYDSESSDDIDRRFDIAFDILMNSISSIDSDEIICSFYTPDYSKLVKVFPSRSSVRDFLYMSLSYAECFIGAKKTDIIVSSLHPTFKSALETFLTTLCNFSPYQARIDYGDIAPVNLYKVIAYQQICAQYFSNDHIDNVYSSKLWMSNQYSLMRSAYHVNRNSSDFYSVNGVNVLYDTYSSHYLNYGISFFDNITTIESLLDVLANSDSVGYYHFLINTFTFQNSLKYGDYFIGARSQPLAVGDVSISVSNSKVSAVDTTKGITYQRFLNAVNRAGSYIKDYVKSIFGVSPEQSEPMPNFLSRETFIIGKDEIDNTSGVLNSDGVSSQGNVVTNLIDTDGRFAFDIFVDTPSVILGLVSFDAIGCYKFVTEKDNYHIDRYDMFNPMLQNIGDQSIEKSELLPDTPKGNTFGYQVRNAEYKFKVNQCHGGFAYNLPSWLFINDVQRQQMLHISPYVIRHLPSDFDKFYTSLTYGSQAGYFHFILQMNNEVKSNRRMQYEPSIL